ncbi:MAG TPA: cupin domain-containing protein [Phenylobacterium sp.]|uniref:cupin domain-containing protein n=1 Tax=Phenylobacterium sp. TaxID=1871053 RepID=UPI002B47CAFA|nr:cupin domain-containing protein [Phenylobacterium sp.]HKR87341.1 cupin domain-containing protein [Phenylobacterium sp.]
MTERTEPTATEPTATTTERTADPDPVSPGLAGLIGPAEVAGFLKHSLGQAVYRTRLAPAAAAELFGWPQLNAALAEHRLAPPRLRLERAGADVTHGIFRARRTRRGAVLQDLDVAALTASLRDGATLIVDAVNEISPPLQRLCAGLSAELTAASQANLYACWGVTQGFDVHWDDHDVFVVQVEGRKQWALYGPTKPAPTRRGPAADAPSPQGEPEQIVLGPGDVLYLPRGHWHAAVGLGEPTLHLTIGLTRKTGGDLFQWLADEVFADEIGRADLPFEAGDAAVAERLARLVAGLAARDPQDLARRYRRHVEALQPQRPALSFPHIGEEEAPLAAGAELSLAPGPARLRRSERGLVLSWRGVEFTLAPDLEPLLRRLLAGETASIDAFGRAAPGASAAQLQGFLREMLRRGVFVVRADAAP